MAKISADEINIITKYIKDISGISLDPSKAYLIETRLKNILEETGCASYGELYSKAKADATKSIEKKIVDAIPIGRKYIGNIRLHSDEAPEAQSFQILFRPTVLCRERLCHSRNKE